MVKKQFANFLVSGTIGFITDSAILHVLIYAFGMGDITARICSFLVAVHVTWLCNRRLTFAILTAPTWSEYRGYMLSNTAIAALNILLYSIFLQFIPACWYRHLLAVSMATGITMFINFSWMKFMVFRR